MSIASEISRLQTAKADLKTSIEGKGVTVPSGAKLDDYPDLVDAIQTGGGGGDWDWVKNDGKHYFHIDLPTGMLNMPLIFKQTQSNGVVVDWGDGSTPETFSGDQIETSHQYSAEGKYIISLDVQNGEIEYGKPADSWANCLFGPYNTNNTNNTVVSYTFYVNKIEIGNGMRGGALTMRGLCDCRTLTHVYISDWITILTDSWATACNAIRFLRIPTGVTNFGHQNGALMLKEIDIKNNRLTACSLTAMLAATKLSFRMEEPASSYTIWNFLHQNCPNMKEIHIYNSDPPWLRSTPCGGIKGDYTIYVPKGSKSAYEQATNWSTVASHIVEE